MDWSRGYQALDKEFQQIVRRARVGKQVADMLFRVWLKDGAECWLLVHVEVQGAYEKEFARRMFHYNVASFRLYNREVVSLAVLCDERPNWRPTTFGYGRWGSWTSLTFPIVKLLDFAQDREALERNDNPFAVVTLAHLQAQATRGDAEKRREWKFRLVRRLYQRQFTKEDVRELFRLIDWIMDLPADLEDQFREEVYRYEEEQKMPYLSSLERRGLEEGLAKGLAKGRALGLREGLLHAIAVALQTKFGAAGRKLLTRAKKLDDPAALRRLVRVVQTAETLDDVRQHLP